MVFKSMILLVACINHKAVVLIKRSKSSRIVTISQVRTYENLHVGESPFINVLLNETHISCFITKNAAARTIQYYFFLRIEPNLCAKLISAHKPVFSCIKIKLRSPRNDYFVFFKSLKS